MTVTKKFGRDDKDVISDDISGRSRIEYLSQLLEMIKDGRDEILWVEYMRAFGLRPDNRHVKAGLARAGNIDDARELHNIVLPEWWLQHMGCYGEGWNVMIETQGKLKYTTGHKEPAVAWLIVIIEALIEELDSHET